MPRSRRPGRPQGANPKEQKPSDIVRIPVSSDPATQAQVARVIIEREAQKAGSAESIAPAVPVASPAEKPTRATADCESAREDSCSCRCRGKYHGKPHPKGWKDEEGCHPLNEAERKKAKKAALYSWRKAHPERVSAYMKAWRTEKKEKEAVAKEASEDVAAEEAEGENEVEE